VADIAPAKDRLDAKEYWVENLGTHFCSRIELTLRRKKKKLEERSWGGALLKKELADS
jgi:hypothetical protein